MSTFNREKGHSIGHHDEDCDMGRFRFITFHKVPVLTIYILHKDVTHVEATLGLPSAVIGKRVVVKEQKNVDFATILRCLKSHPPKI